MDERVRFVGDYLTGGLTMTELCRRYGVSRPTGYQLVARYQAAGAAGLAPQSRRPHTSPQAIPPATADALVTLRQRHPEWGPVKLIAALRRRDPTGTWPAPSTAGALLKARGLIQERRRRSPPTPSSRPTTPMDAPNAVWTIDFKGEFRTRDAAWCYPLTVMDGFSRYLLACQALRSTASAPAQAVLTRVFREFGLPARIRSDNGVPFAGPTALARLSRLAVWWIRLGIAPERIQPGCPAQNGRHERMHRTLKRGTTRPPAGNQAAQQRRFVAWRQTYNVERPHQALAGVPPATVYVPSARPFPATLPSVTYPGHFETRQVVSNGCLKWRGHWVSVSAVLVHETVGLEELADGIWAVYFGPLRLGTFDERTRRIRSGRDKDAATTTAKC